MSEVEKQLCEVIAKVAEKIDHDKALRLEGIITGAVLFSDERSVNHDNS